MEKVICIDLDDTIFNFVGPFVQFCEKVVTCPIKKDKLKEGVGKWRSWDGFKNYGISEQEFQKILTRFYQGGGLRTLPICVKNPKYNLNNLTDKGWKIIFVTKRPSYTVWQSVDYLRQEMGIKFHSLYSIDKDEGSVIYNYEKDEYFPCNVVSKYDVFMIEKPLAVFDDASHYVVEAMEAGVPHVYLVNRTHNAAWRKTAKDRFPQLECISPIGWGYMNDQLNKLEQLYG